MKTTSASLPPEAIVVGWEKDPEGSEDPVWLGPAAWGEGPWQDEPDRVEWRVPGSALPRLVLRNRTGNWCGYVGLPPGHRYHGQAYDTVVVDVHGGLTFGRECAGHICHVPRDGEPEHVYWLGFDCGHSGDYSPGMEAHLRRSMGASYSGGTYRTVDYVIAETEQLARQLDAQ